MIRFFALIAVILQSSVAVAQADFDSPHEELDLWLRAQVINQRCRQLRYYEVIHVEQGVMDAAGKTPEVAAALAGEGSATVANDMFRERRIKAIADVADRACAQDDPDIQWIRARIFASILPFVMATSDPRAEAVVPDAVLEGRNFLFLHMQAVLGDGIENAAESMRYITLGMRPEDVWPELQPTLLSAMWERTLGMKSYKFEVSAGRDSRFWFKPTEDGVSAFQGSFLKTQAHRALGSDGGVIRVSQALGLDYEDQLVVVVAIHEDEKKLLASEILVQTEPKDLSAWFAEDWRLHTTRFLGIALPDEACPADQCFRFPKAATAAIRERLNTEDIYAVELVIAARDQVPVSNYSDANARAMLDTAIFE